MIILGYHNIVADETPAAPQDALLAVRASQFAQQIRYLTRCYEVSTLDGRGSRPARPSVVLTFDDGYRSFMTYAMPVLQAYKIPAYVFVNPAYVGGWNHRDKLLGLAVHGSARAVTAVAAAFGVPSLADRFRVFSLLRHAMWRALRDRGEPFLGEIDALFDRYADGRVRAGLDPCRLLSWADLAELQAQGILVGNHTLRHLDLDSLTRPVVRHQIRSAQEQLRMRLHTDERVLSYPRGRVNGVAVEEAEHAGYAWGLTMTPGVVPAAATLLATRVMVSPTDTGFSLRWKSSRLRLWARQRPLARLRRSLRSLSVW